MNQRIEKQIGANIRALRERAGMTRDIPAAGLRLAGCDTTRSAIAKIEGGQRHLYPDELILQQRILGVSYEEILRIPD